MTTATAEASNRSQIYAALQGKAFPKPSFGAQLIALTDIACGYLQNLGSCIFSLQQAENEVDLLAQRPPNGLGVSMIQINLDPFYFVDNSNNSPNARTLFENVMSYIYTHYGPGNTYSNPVVHVRLEPSYTSNNLNTVCHTLTGTTPNPLTSPTDLATCMTATPAISAPWLQIGGTTYSVYQFLAKTYGPSGSVPITSDFSDIHEPTSNNANSAYSTQWNCTGSSCGTAANWASAFNTMANAVNAGDGGINNGIAFDRFESAYASAMLSTPLSHIIYVGGDEYTTGINNSPTCTYPALCGDMGNLASILGLAKNTYGLRVLFTESWLPSWTQGSVGADGSAYEGLGNCDWQTLDFNRQTLMATSLWASANGLSEVNLFSAANTSTTCVYGGLNNGNDRITSTSYMNAVAAASSLTSNSVITQKTKTFYWLQQLINNWPVFVATGEQLPI